MFLMSSFLSKVAKKKHLKISDVDKKWKKAKRIAKKQIGEDNYAYTTGVFKRMMSFESFVNEKYGK
jgi:hypothetical protein